MPGLNDWFDVFKCGTHRDHSGVMRTITESEIDKAISAYRTDSAPIVVGHPTLNAPAYGWIKDFRRSGATVQARASSVVPEFTEAVKKGLYNNRSLSFNSDGTFRHVGFLGAAAPAVKGLEEIQFSDEGECITVDLPEAVKVTAEAPEEQAPSEVKGSSTIEDLTRKIQELEGKLTAEQTKRRRMEFAAYTDSLVNAGRLKAAVKDQVIETMEALHATDSADFADAENSHLNRFKELLTAILPEKRVEFMEFAAPSRAARNCIQHIHPEELAQRAQQLVEQNRIQGVFISASDAVNKIVGGEYDAQSHAH